MAEMKSSTSLAELQGKAAPPALPTESVEPFSLAGWGMLKEMAKGYSQANNIPDTYKGKPADCYIALDMACRLHMMPLSVMQNLYIVHGRPAWSAAFLVGMFNTNPNFTPLDYEFKGDEGTEDWGCRAFAYRKGAEKPLLGTWITMRMAKAEGWLDKPGSKWKTMPEQMLRYRAAAFFIRAFAPEQGMGITHTAEELIDGTIDITPEAVTTTASIAAAEATRAASAPKADSTVVAEPAAPQESAPAKGKKGAAAKKDAPAQATPAPSAAKEQPTSLLDAKEERIKPETLAAIRADLRRLGVDEDCLPPDLSKEFQTSDPGELDEPDAQRCLALLKTY